MILPYFIEVCDFMRVYYAPREQSELPPYNGERSGFEAEVWGDVGSTAPPYKRFGEGSILEQTASFSAAFDGVRHMNIGDDTGYISYPDLQVLSKMLAIVAELESMHCRDA